MRRNNSRETERITKAYGVLFFYYECIIKKSVFRKTVKTVMK